MLDTRTCAMPTDGASLKRHRGENDEDEDDESSAEN